MVKKRDTVVKLPGAKDIELEIAAATKEDVKIPSPSIWLVGMSGNNVTEDIRSTGTQKLGSRRYFEKGFHGIEWDLNGWILVGFKDHMFTRPALQT